MRKLGIAALGLIGGLLFAIVLQDILVRSLSHEDNASSPVRMILGSLWPTFGLLGAALALWLDRSHRKGRSKETTYD